MSIVQCLGGWCRSREKCAHYHAVQTINRAPVERLCGAKDEPEPIIKVVAKPEEATQ